MSGSRDCRSEACRGRGRRRGWRSASRPDLARRGNAKPRIKRRGHGFSSARRVLREVVEDERLQSQESLAGRVVIEVDTKAGLGTAARAASPRADAGVMRRLAVDANSALSFDQSAVCRYRSSRCSDWLARSSSADCARAGKTPSQRSNTATMTVVALSLHKVHNTQYRRGIRPSSFIPAAGKQTSTNDALPASDDRDRSAHRVRCLICMVQRQPQLADAHC